MSPQRYERVPEQEQHGHETSSVFQVIPSSPPPSFRSRASSPTSLRLAPGMSSMSDVDRTLADTFDDGDVSGDEDRDGGDVRQRLMRRSSSPHTLLVDNVNKPERQQRTATVLPHTNLPSLPRRGPGIAPFTTFSSSNDGVFANLDAKPELGEKLDEQPPSYEQAAADATPPYWETTILAPGMVSDEVYVDGLPVGSLFSFAWNGVISMSFNFVGFLLTYLLHTTHAAKNGSRAGLGVTLVQYGFYMKSSASRRQGDAEPQYGQPTDPNNHDFDPSAISSSAAAAAVAAVANSQSDGSNGVSHKGLATTEWLAYILMIAGWFILIRAVTDFIKARRHEQLVLQSPDRGLNIPVVAEGETSETVV